jgi:16S rRNA processing protein RimM
VVDVLSAGNDLLEVQLATTFSSEFAHDQKSNEVGSSAENPVQALAKRRTKPKPVHTVLIPFVKAIVPVVDIVEQRIEITPPPGLMEI